MVRIGRGFSNRTFDGLIDDVRVWGRPISVTEVQNQGNGMGDLGPKPKLSLTQSHGVVKFPVSSSSIKKLVILMPLIALTFLG